MRFLLLTQYFPPEVGAPQTRLAALASELRRLGHDVEVVTTMPNYPRGFTFPEYRGKFYACESRDGVRVHRVWGYPALGAGMRRALNYLSFALLSIFGLMQARRPDYLFVESPPLVLSAPGWLFARIWKARFIVNVADISPKTEVALGFVRSRVLQVLLFELERWTYRRADRVNAITEGVRHYLLEEALVPSRKVLFLPNGVNTEQFQPRILDLDFKRTLGLEDKQIILYPGTHGHAHALETALEAAKLLESSTNIHFLFVGDGSAKPALRKRANELRLTNVTFHDPVPLDQLVRFFSIADCALASIRNLPEYDSARPAKMFPILASGVPLVFAGKGEAAALVAKAGGGLVVPPNNPGALAAAVISLMGDSERRAELSRNGRRFVEQNYQWSKLVSEWISSLLDAQAPRQILAPASSRS